MVQPARSSVGAVVAAVLVGAWAVVVTVVLQVLGWGIDQVLLVLGLGRPWWSWPLISLVNAVLVAVPAIMLARIPRSAAVRAAGRVWLAGAVAVGLLGAARMVPPTEPELYLAVFTLAAVALSLRRRVPALPAAPPRGWFGVAAGLVVLVPWLWIGALGGALETLLATAAAAVLGWLAAAVLNQPFWSAFGPTRTRLVLVGGLVGGVTLLLLAAGTGGSGAQLPLLLVLPPLGFAAAALAALSPPAGRWAVAGLVGVAALGPLAFVDPEEVTLLLTGRDVPFWTALAAACSLGLALVLGLLYLLAPRGFGRPGVGAAVVGVLVVAAAAVHLGLGQPGLHGERLFVVMAEQADLSELPAAAPGQAGRDARATEVYRRLVTHAEESQADLRAELDRLRLPYTPYYLVNAVEVAGGPEVRAWLAGRDDVDRVLRSQRLRPLPALGPPTTGRAGLAPEVPEWNITMIGADRVWEELDATGAGIVVGTSDSGVDGDHPALASGFRGGGDSWLDPWNDTATPTDRSGHGTHTLGSAVGRDGIGVAPDAQWTSCVNLDRNLGNPPRYLDCLQFMLAPYPPGADPFRDGRPERAPHVLTNSWACPPVEGCDDGALRPATAALQAAGLYVVAAAGNAGPLCESIHDPPAPHPDVLTVGAVDRAERVANFSSRGPVDGADKPDVVAPGARVVSAMPGGGYDRLSGTSMATPHVAGVVALMWSANEALIGDVETTTRILRDTTKQLPLPDEITCGGFDALAGAGLVDAHAAVLAASRSAG